MPGIQRLRSIRKRDVSVSGSIYYLVARHCTSARENQTVSHTLSLGEAETGVPDNYNGLEHTSGN